MNDFGIFSRGRSAHELLHLYHARLLARPHSHPLHVGRMAHWPQALWDELFQDCPDLRTEFQAEVRRLLTANREAAHDVLDTALRYYPEWISRRTRQHRTSSRYRRMHSQEARKREYANSATYNIQADLNKARARLARAMPLHEQVVMELLAPALLVRTQLEAHDPHPRTPPAKPRRRSLPEPRRGAHQAARRR